jgi:hypothetical protein
LRVLIAKTIFSRSSAFRAAMATLLLRGAGDSYWRLVSRILGQTVESALQTNHLPIDILDLRHELFLAP